MEDVVDLKACKEETSLGDELGPLTKIKENFIRSVSDRDFETI